MPTPAPKLPDLIRIAGVCPMCGGTLEIDTTWSPPRIVCAEFLCPDENAVHKLLEDAEREHIVRIEEERFHVKHPLRERVGDAMLDCIIHTQLSHTDGPPAPSGVYRVRRDAEGYLDFEAVAT